MATNAIAPQTIETEKKKRVRSPNYPTVSLKEAIDRARRFVNTDGRAGAIPAIAAKHIGFASAHGQAYSVLSALKKFGLVEDKDGRIVPSQRAMEIVNLPESDERRKRAIRDAAMSPALYAETIKEYRSTGLPSDETLRGELIAYKGFNSNGVGEFLKGFRETLEFAGLTDFSALDPDDKADQNPTLKVGDHVQWISQGAEQFKQAKRITGFGNDGKIALVEGEKTGFPIDQIEVVAPPESGSATKTQTERTFAPREVRQGMKQDVFSLDGGGEIVITWPSPLSPEVIDDIKDWLRIVERKIARSVDKNENKEEDAE